MDSDNFFLWAMGICVVGALLFIISPQPLTRLMMSFGQDRDLRNRAEKTREALGTFLAGLAVFLTFLWTTTKDKADALRAERQENNRQYIAAAQLLRRDDKTISTSDRAAGIFALANLARAENRFTIPVRDTIRAVIYDQLMNGNVPVAPLSRPDTLLLGGFVGSDINAAVYSLGTRDKAHETDEVGFSLDHAYLIGAKMAYLASFAGTTFYGARLSGADFRCSDLTDARFAGAQMADWQNFQTGGKTTFDDAIKSSDWESFRKYNFGMNFEGATIRGADFSGRGTMLSGADFVGADLTSVHFDGANLSRVDFGAARNFEKALFSSDTNGTACADEMPRLPEGNPHIRVAGNAGTATAVLVNDRVAIMPCHGNMFIAYKFKPLDQVISYSRDKRRCPVRP